ncbi:MAG: Dabb family protein [Planctomycetota bacterium]|nr:Dabb family protein [Planctomycetota bacterium]MDA1141600.1 Dabb family protein [Planctomycetota bacterium]
MIEHIVLFKVREGTPQAKVDGMLAGIKSLKDSIDTVVSVSMGKNFSERSQGFTHGIVVRFNNKEGLAAYQPHPAHLKVVKEDIKPIVDDILAVDYEF